MPMFFVIIAEISFNYIINKSTSPGGSSGGSSGAPTIYCSSVDYGPWGACVGSVQTRQVINRSPSACALTTSQQLASTRDCVIEDDEDEDNGHGHSHHRGAVH